MINNTSLIAQLGTVMQLAYVPRDFDAALRYWTETMGVGPFFCLDHVACDQVRHCGVKVALDFSVYIGYWGNLQIELIRQHNDAPSIYKTWLDEGREGLHHVCIVVDDLVHARKVCSEAGAQVMQEAWISGGGEAIYVDAGGGPGGLIEILCMPGSAELFAMMREQARNWDGTDPIRTLG